MSDTTDKTIDYFKSFTCEVLTSNVNNKNILSEFVSKKVNNSLESYLKHERGAWNEDLSGETRVYLIKDTLGKVAMYFSVKCGMLVGIPEDENLTEDEQAFVESFIQFRIKENQQGLDTTYEAVASIWGYDRADELYALSNRKTDRKTEAKEIGQSEHTLNVPACISAIELRHLCKNENYIPEKDIGVPLGFGIFWEVIVPKILEITDMVGCKYIYLFAADKTQTESDRRIMRLVDYYKNNFKFMECDENIKLIKPDYDMSCYGLIQDVSSLRHNKENIWAEFSDTISEGCI